MAGHGCCWMRSLHRWPGLVLAVLLFVTSLSGAALSLFPALEAAQAPTAADTLTVAFPLSNAALEWIDSVTISAGLNGISLKV